MRSVIIKDRSNIQCGICKEGKPWISEMNREGICFIYCRKCNTITFLNDVEYNIQMKIEKIINKENVLKKANKKHD